MLNILLILLILGRGGGRAGSRERREAAALRGPVPGPGGGREAPEPHRPRRARRPQWRSASCILEKTNKSNCNCTAANCISLHELRFSFGKRRDLSFFANFAKPKVAHEEAGDGDVGSDVGSDRPRAMSFG